MPIRVPTWPLALFFALLLGGCGGKDDPQAALEAAVQQLQDNIEAKDTGAVMAQLHPDFLARQELDREWAKRTMTLLFLRHKNIQVIALGKNSWIDAAIAKKLGLTYTRYADDLILSTDAKEFSREKAQRAIGQVTAALGKWGLGDHDGAIAAILSAIKQLMEPPPAPPKRRIGFR